MIFLKKYSFESINSNKTYLKESSEMFMIIAINYADEKYKKAQKINTKSAYRKGKVDKVIEYGPKDIDLEFQEENKKIFEYSRGAGLWIWKPYFILKTLNKINDGDYLFYCDAGAYYINSIQYLIDEMENNNQEIMLYELPLISKQWTKEETFIGMNCINPIYKDSNQILATYILVKKSNNTVAFFEEFLHCCKNETLISFKTFNKNIENDKSFIAHREDQSILSILAIKYKLIPFRDPSQYGIRPWEYLQNDYLFQPKTYCNSNFPQIIVSYRSANIVTFKLKEKLKNYLFKCGILNEQFYRKKNSIK